MTSNLPDNWNEEAFEQAWGDKPTCEDCKHYHLCDCGDHGWCDELLEFTQPDDSCEWGEL